MRLFLALAAGLGWGIVLGAFGALKVFDMLPDNEPPIPAYRIIEKPLTRI